MNKENCALKLVDEIILYIRYTMRLVCELVSACLIELNEQWTYEQFTPYVYSLLKLYMVEILSTVIHYIWFRVSTIIIL